MLEDLLANPRYAMMEEDHYYSLQLICISENIYKNSYLKIPLGEPYIFNIRIEISLLKMRNKNKVKLVSPSS